MVFGVGVGEFWQVVVDVVLYVVFVFYCIQCCIGFGCGVGVEVDSGQQQLGIFYYCYLFVIFFVVFG